MQRTKAAEPAYAQKGTDMTLYDKKLMKITARTARGDDVKLQLPVKRLIGQAGKLPLPDDMVRGIETSEIIGMISDCFEAETEGELLNTASADGSKLSISIGD